MTYIPETVRCEIIARAAGFCEYCRLHERHTLKKHEVDHIRAEKHGGTTTSENLCLSCFDCNRRKGRDLSSVDPITDEVVPLFHPHRDAWRDLFTLLISGTIEGVTAKGRVTVALLHFNALERVVLRSMLIKLGELSAE